MSNQLTIQGLQCERGERVLFSNLSFTIEPGQLCHLNGTNGSGKTTLLRTIAGYTLPYAGTVNWNNEPATLANYSYTQSYRFIGHQNGLKKNLSARENLDFFKQLHGLNATVNDVSQALNTLNINDQSQLSVQELSQGQQRKTALARLLLGSSKLWILDEPFTSLDQASCGLLEDLMKRHLDQEGSIVLATHQALQKISPASIHLVELGHE